MFVLYTENRNFINLLNKNIQLKIKSNGKEDGWWWFFWVCEERPVKNRAIKVTKTGHLKFRYLKLACLVKIKINKLVVSAKAEGRPLSEVGTLASILNSSSSIDDDLGQIVKVVDVHISVHFTFERALIHPPASPDPEHERSQFVSHTFDHLILHQFLSITIVFQGQFNGEHQVTSRDSIRLQNCGQNFRKSLAFGIARVPFVSCVIFLHMLLTSMLFFNFNIDKVQRFVCAPLQLSIVSGKYIKKNRNHSLLRVVNRLFRRHSKVHLHLTRLDKRWLSRNLFSFLIFSEIMGRDVGNKASVRCRERRS